MHHITAFFYSTQCSVARYPMRAIMIGLALVQVLIGSGVVYGWASLLLLLKKEGVYSESCAPGEEICPEQELKLNLVYTVAISVLVAASLPVGMLMDWIGARRTIALGWVGFLSGCLVFAFSSADFDAYIYGYTMIAMSGMAVYFSIFKSSQAWGALQKRVQVLVTCTFDASSGVFLAFWYLSKLDDSITVLQFFSYYTIPVAVIAVVYLFIWPKGVTGDPVPKSNEVKVELDKDDSTPSDEKAVDLDDKTPLISSNDSSGEVAFSKLADLPFWKQVLTPEFIIYELYLMVATMWLNMYFGTVEARMLQFLPQDRVVFLVEMFSLILPASFLVAPVISYLSVLPHSFHFWCIHMSGILFSMLIFLKFEWVLYPTFILFSCYRMMFYATVNTYIVTVFGFKNLGKLLGLAGAIAGAFNAIQYWFLELVFDTYDGKFLVIDYIQLGSYLVLTIFPIYLMTSWHRRHFNHLR